MNYQSDQLFDVIRAVRRRRTLLAVLKGVAITLAVFTADAFVDGLGGVSLSLSARAHSIGLRVVAVLAVVSAAVYLRARAAACGGASPTSKLRGWWKSGSRGWRNGWSVRSSSLTLISTRVLPRPIIDRLLNDADEKARAVDLDAVVPRKRFWQLSGAALASVALLSAVLVFGPREIRSGVAQLVTPASPVAAANALRMEVKPGTARVPKSSDQKITAGLLNFDSEGATVFTRRAGERDDQWIGQPMEPAKNKNDFQFFLFNIQADTEYFIESAGCRSETFKLTVVDLPSVKRIDQTQFFPGYTGLAPKVIEDAPEVAVLAGSQIKLTARLTGAAKSARIVLRDGTKVTMENVGENAFAATLTINKETSYHIELTSNDGDVLQRLKRIRHYLARRPPADGHV